MTLVKESIPVRSDHLKQPRHFSDRLNLITIKAIMCHYHHLKETS